MNEIFRYLIFGVLLVVFLVAIVFASVNTEPVTLDLAFSEVSTTLSMAMLIFFTAGWVFGVFCLGIYLIRLMAERRQLRRQLQLAEAEVTSLRRMPMQDAH
ncbi:MAG: lipopolysaccharide assembly protein LapA domain-containing protein [Gammaproteobacteria bacterium]